MFALVTTFPRQNLRPIRRIKAAWGRLAPEVRLCRVENVPYFVIDCALSRRGIPWEQVRLSAGGEASRLLLPVGQEPLPGTGVTRYDDSQYRRRLLVNTALEIFRIAGESRRLAVALIDPAGRCPGVAAELLRVCSQLSVLTMRPAAYDKCCRYTMEEMGACAVLTRDPQAVDACDAVVAPYGLQQVDGVRTGGRPVFSGVNTTDTLGFCQGGFTLKKPWVADIPPDISLLAFAAALHESARFPPLGLETLSCLSLNDREISVAHCVKMLGDIA